MPAILAISTTDYRATRPISWNPRPRPRVFRFVRRLLTCSVLVAGPASGELIIDDFEDAPAQFQASRLTPERQAVLPVRNATSVAGRRLFQVRLPTGRGPDLYLGISGYPATGHQLVFRQNPVPGGFGSGTAYIEWRGGRLPQGLDLTEGGRRDGRFVIEVRHARPDVRLRLRVNGVWQRAAVPVDPGGSGRIEIPFSAFPGVDFTSVTRLALQLESRRANSRIAIDALRTGFAAPSGETR